MLTFRQLKKGRLLGPIGKELGDYKSVGSCFLLMRSLSAHLAVST